MTDTAPVVKTTIMRSRADVTAFLAGFPDLDAPISWTCPECGTVNPDAYYSHQTRCMKCDKGFLPSLSLPIRCAGKGAIDLAIFEARLTQIDEEIHEYQGEIREFEGEIADREEWIRQCRKDRKSVEEDIARLNRGTVIRCA